MEEDWEQLAERKQEQLAASQPDGNKWAGEDEDDVKDSWEDDEEDEEKKDEEKVQVSASAPKMTLQQKIFEKEKLKQQEAERKRLEEEEEKNLTPEQRLAERLRLQKLQEEADLKTALETLGVSQTAGEIDGMHPTNKEEFIALADAISKKLSNYKNDPNYSTFLDDLVMKLFASVSSSNIRKSKTTLENLFLEKQKLEKGDKPKKTKGVKVKAKLRVEGDNSNLDEYPTKFTDYDDYDDFM